MVNSFVRGEYKDRTVNSATAEMGSHITLDITELFSSKVNIKQETLTFVVRGLRSGVFGISTYVRADDVPSFLQLYTEENAEASVFGMTHVSFDYYPQIIVEGALTEREGDLVG